MLEVLYFWLIFFFSFCVSDVSFAVYLGAVTHSAPFTEFSIYDRARQALSQFSKCKKKVMSHEFCKITGGVVPFSMSFNGWEDLVYEYYQTYLRAYFWFQSPIRLFPIPRLLDLVGLCTNCQPNRLLLLFRRSGRSRKKSNRLGVL